MIFDDMPRPIAKEVYDEAQEVYAKKVADRAIALYRVGNIDFPGLSDIDLLVVPADSHRDNSQFFSVFDRLPRRFHCVFRHPPTVLPQTALDVMQYTSHSQPLLIVGADVLKGRKLLTTREEHWCKILESYCNQDSYLSRCLSAGRTSGARAVAMSSSLRYPLRWVDAEVGTDHAVAYARDIDTRRTALFLNPGKDQALVHEIWALHVEKMRWLRDFIVERLPLKRDESVQRFSARFLRGDASFDSLDQAGDPSATPGDRRLSGRPWPDALQLRRTLRERDLRYARSAISPTAPRAADLVAVLPCPQRRGSAVAAEKRLDPGRELGQPVVAGPFRASPSGKIRENT